MQAVVIKAGKLGKTFTRSQGARRWLSFTGRGLQAAPEQALRALHNVSFEVRAGEMLGIVGANGAGKSTLLRMLGGIGQPTSGSLEMHGRIGALLELGGGFQPDLTGRENVILAAVVAGLLQSEAEERLPEMVRFAGLEEFIDAPVRTYSTGMTMRLAFAVAVHTDPDILLVDEFLSVGDLAFQAKCNTRIAAMRKAGCAVVLVSHGMDQVRELCDRALWLRRGEVVAYDTTEVVAEAYEEEMRLASLQRTPITPVLTTRSGTELRAGDNRIGSQEVIISDVVLLPGPVIRGGASLAVEISYHAANRVTTPLFGVGISRADGTICLDVNTASSRVEVPDVDGAGTIRLVIDRLDLAPGAYFVDVGVYETNWKFAYDYHWQAYPLTIEGKASGKGLILPPCRWSVSKVDLPA